MTTRNLLAALLATCAVCEAQESADVTSEKSTVVAAWGLTLVELDHCRPESDVCDTELFVEDAKKERRLLASGLTGPFVPLVRARKVFSCEGNSVMETKGPALIALNGQRATLPPHPGHLRACSTAGTGEEMLLVYSLVDLAKPYSFVRVIGSSGRVIVEKRLDTEGDIEFKVSGKTHKVRVPAPEFPG